jgi:hypothetical protein
MNVNINCLLAQDPYALEVFCDYLEENATTANDQNLYLFLHSRQHEERGFCDNIFGPMGDGDGYGQGSGLLLGDGSGIGYVDGWGGGYGNGYWHDYGDGIGWGDEGNQ